MPGWRAWPRRDSPLGTTGSNPFRGFRYSAEAIQLAAWLHHGFSLREAETILAALGIEALLRQLSTCFASETFAASAQRFLSAHSRIHNHFRLAVTALPPASAVPHAVMPSTPAAISPELLPFRELGACSGQFAILFPQPDTELWRAGRPPASDKACCDQTQTGQTEED